jgi:predicted site-specific integrase-resolvase
MVMPQETRTDGMTLAEAARRLGVSTQWVHDMGRRGNITVVRTPLGNRYDVADVERERARRIAWGRLPQGEGEGEDGEG